MNWTVEEDGFKKENIEFFGSKFSVGNGYMGHRGTLEGYGKSQLVSLTLARLYNDAGRGTYNYGFGSEPQLLQNRHAV